MSRKIKELYSLDGQVAIVTGGAGLLGEMHAEAIAELGGNVVLVDIDFRKLQSKTSRLIQEFDGRVTGLEVDITSESAIMNLRDQVLGKYGRLDILINNAASNPSMAAQEGTKNFSRLENFTLEEWARDLAIGLTGTFLCCKILGHAMAQKKRGVIINVASDLGIIAPDQRIYKKAGVSEDEQPVKPLTYSVVKGGVLSLTRYLATYWAEKGIRVNSISPGGIYTNQDKEFVSKLSQLIPLGRMASLDEYKGAIAFLASDASSYMTGSNLVIEGGRTIW